MTTQLTNDHPAIYNHYLKYYEIRSNYQLWTNLLLGFFTVQWVGALKFGLPYILVTAVVGFVAVILIALQQMKLFVIPQLLMKLRWAPSKKVWNIALMHAIDARFPRWREMTAISPQDATIFASYIESLIPKWQEARPHYTEDANADAFFLLENFILSGEYYTLLHFYRDWEVNTKSANSDEDA
jgi:hypothetical protein